MTKATRETLFTLAYLVLGLAASAASGYFTVGKVMFSHLNVLLGFLIIGFSGSLVYAAVRLRGIGYALLMVVLMFFGRLALTPPLSAGSAINAALWAVPVGAAFLSSAYAFKALKRIPIGKFVLMAILVGLALGFGTVLILLHAHNPLLPATILRQAVGGLKMGALVGLAMEIVDFFGRRRSRNEEEDISVQEIRL